MCQKILVTMLKKRLSRKLLLALLLTTIVLPGWSKPIDENMARKVASQTLLGSTTKTLKLIYKSSNVSKPENDTVYAVHQTDFDEIVYFYIFVTENNDGFVIVAGDDRIAPVLGYSDTNGFYVDNMPDNLKWWLDEYAKQIQYAIEIDYEPTAEIKQQWTKIMENKESVINQQQ